MFHNIRGNVLGVLATVLVTLVGCGRLSHNESEVQQFNGSGKHVIVGTDVNVRNDDLSAVKFTVSSGVKMTPTGATQNGLGYVFYKVNL